MHSSFSVKALGLAMCVAAIAGLAAPAGAQTGGYAGEATCLTCHEAQDYKGTAHALTTNGRTPAATHGCESCHGPGQAHADAGGDTTKIVRIAKLTPQRCGRAVSTISAVSAV